MYFPNFLKCGAQEDLILFSLFNDSYKVIIPMLLLLQSLLQVTYFLPIHLLYSLRPFFQIIQSFIHFSIITSAVTKIFMEIILPKYIIIKIFMFFIFSRIRMQICLLQLDIFDILFIFIDSVV